MPIPGKAISTEPTASSPAWRTRFEHWRFGRGLKSAADLTLPDFLGIGAQKSGTSWLHENLRHHPDVFVSPIKEVHYFDEHFNQPLRDYASIFQPGAQKIKGEVTPAYGILPAARIRYIRAVMPRVRLIFLMRNPIQRAWSHALMILVTQAGRNFEDVDRKEFLDHFQGKANLHRGDYEMILNTWLGVFPREQLFLGFFDDIASRPVELLQDVCRHIKVRTDADWEQFPYRQKIYSGPGISMPSEYWLFLRELYQSRIQRLRPMLGAGVDRWLLDSNSVR